MTDDRQRMTSKRGGRHEPPRLPLAAEASAPAKLILCGEHAVVYNRPAIALPLADVRARVRVSPRSWRGVHFSAPNLRRRWTLAERPDDTLSMLANETLHSLNASPTNGMLVTIRSKIPIASGMGSGAAVATALVRALAAASQQHLTNEHISALVYENERRLHGTPSGIDNTVVAFERPIWFVRQAVEQQGEGETKSGDESSSLQPPASSAHALIEPLSFAAPFTLVVADTGVRSATRMPVGEVRRRWLAEPARYEALFDEVRDVVVRVRGALAEGDIVALGSLLDRNHELLHTIGVSSPELDRLVHAAKAAGALGAKLSGAGWGGVMFALVTPETQERVIEALREAGASSIRVNTVHATIP